MEYDKMIYNLSVLHKFSSREDKEALGMALDILCGFNTERAVKTAMSNEEQTGDLVSKDFMKKMGATCIAKRNESGELVAISSIDILPSAEKIAINLNERVKVKLTDY